MGWCVVVRPGVVGTVDPHRLHARFQRALRIQRGVVAHVQHLVGQHIHGRGRRMEDAHIGLGYAKVRRADAVAKVAADANAVDIGIAVGHRHHRVTRRQKSQRIVRIGKQLLMTRGALTTFSVANDVAKYFAIVPALFMIAIPELAALNIMHLHSPESAILSAVIFNAIIIPILIPLALRGVQYKPIGASALLRRNLLIYGLGGVIVPFVGIKLIDLLVGLFF